MRRDGIIILGICVAAIVIGGGFFLMSSGASSLSSGQEVGVIVLGKGTSAQMIERKNYRVTNQEEFQSVWSIAYGPDAPALPIVDFASQEVLAVFDGERPNGGYAIEIASVMDGSGKRAITITHSMPGENCIVTDAITSPFQIVAVPATTREIARTDNETVVACE